jgi:hypothetical protein
VMEALRQRRAGDEDATEEETEEQEALVPLEEQMAGFWEFANAPDGFSVSIRPPVIEMPLLKRLGEANFVPAPGIETLLRSAFQIISEKAIEAAYHDNEETDQ